ncbi:cyclohexanone monooxygenase [Sphingomonas sp. Leaf357]|uniref:flavin-containing monooxygenase n=1 Tax=Sphingomonas sp. Leaf357 TaxID=1736350 RepID=UPI0007010FA0|nr:NAD(P)/FAD-dependent oxidoreductase [Sphingomonas sp. Leaf357]KQS03600.1 cyclohexanone monooxygenase [Sphingomonas sp. Leaf357]
MVQTATIETGRQHPARRRLDALVVGMGFGGMCMLHTAREAGLDVHAIEAGDDVGGTWYWNRYPGARCDVMSIDYSYSFLNELQQEWTWSEKFAAQPEILAYASFVAEKLDLRRDTSFSTRATSVVFDDAHNMWVVETDQGQIYEATYCIMATGPLSIPKGIDVPGQEKFGGEIYLTGRWPHGTVDFTGKRVGIIGTGSSGIQAIPVVAEQAEHLTVFQRTPSFTIPMRNSKLTPEYMAQVKEHYPRLRTIAKATHTGGMRPVSTRPMFSVTTEEAQQLLEDGWNAGGQTIFGLFSDLLYDQQTNDVVAAFVRGKIREAVNDPHTAEVLTPHGYPIFSRRPCLDTNYYETFNRDNVLLVDCINEPIEEIIETGIRTGKRDIPLDIIIGATGYDGLTGAMLAVDIKGRGGRSLREKWAGGAHSYLGLMMEGFPNLFMIAGANGPSALANFVILNEQNADWITRCILNMRASGQATIEPTIEAEDRYMDLLIEIAGRSLIPKAKSWYVGANIPGKANFFPIFAGGFARYIDMCNAAASDNYAGFVFKDQRSLVNQD